MNKPDGLSIERQIARMQEEFESCKILHGEKSEWAIEAGSILASLIELRDSRSEEGSFNAAEARCRELEADARVGAAIERGARELPNGAEVEITIEQGAASVYLRHVCGETVCLDVDSDNRLAEEINAAIDAATAREGGEDGQ